MILASTGCSLVQQSFKFSGYKWMSNHVSESTSTNDWFLNGSTTALVTLKSATNGLLRAMNWATRKLTVVNGGSGLLKTFMAKNPMTPDPYMSVGFPKRPQLNCQTVLELLS
ncbi:MAG: hypothetical protein WCG50_04630 [Rhodoferax sp.]|uniref:hypothetical protein n=1 Tax=Rhodoferax sp. TaxID=50421 RepID=UPI00301A396C